MTTIEHALTAPGLREVPTDADALLIQLAAPARLAAHLRLVHDVACDLLDWFGSTQHQLTIDGRAVRFGAATHDIGKVVHGGELSAPGSLHEKAGELLLLEAGVEARLARFAATHGSWNGDGIELEDLLVSLADKVWKARRVADLEQLIVSRLAAASGREPWEVFLELDDRLSTIADEADARLAFQNAYPIE